MSCPIGSSYKIKPKDTLFSIAERELGNLEHPANPETQEEWAKSVDRCDAFSAIVAAGNYDLDGPIKVHTPNHDAIIP